MLFGWVLYLIKEIMMPEEKSSGKGILIIGGLIVSGIIIAMILKTKPVQSTQSLPGGLITIQQMQERIAQLEQQINANATSLTLIPTSLEQRGGLGSEGFGFPLPIDRPQLQPFHSPTSQNLIQYQDGSVTDADVVQQGEKYKNKESWSIKRDADGAITGIDVERNASVGNNAT